MKFNHKLNKENIQELFGYSKALNDVYLHIQEATRGGNQYINALPLIAKIGATSAEIMQMANEYEADLIAKADTILQEEKGLDQKLLDHINKII